MIGVFDSGIGGLTLVKPLREHLPNADIVYFGDTGRVPYGTKSKDTIIKYSHQDVKFLLSRGVDSIIAACGTVSSNAMDILQASYDVPIEGITRPAVSAALRATGSGKIGVIATSATVNSGVFQRLIGDADPRAQVYAKACPLFVPLIENGYVARDCEVTRLVVRDYLTQLRESGIDTLILGCTHYPLIKPIIRDFIPEVTLIDASEAASEEFALHRAGSEDKDGMGKLKIYVSDISQQFSYMAELFLGTGEIDVEKVTVDSY